MANVLTARDKRLLLVCGLVAAGSIWIGANYFYKAFPEASVDFKVPRDQARTIAEKFLADRGADVHDYRYAGVFGYDDSAKTFLEKEMGLEGANALMGSSLHLWRWANRWYKPLQKEEYEVSVTTRGEVVRYAHLIPEERAGSSLDTLAARQKAEAFLTSVMGRDLATLDFVENQVQQRPHRVDYTFTWKEKDWSFHDASHRISIEVDGADIGAYRDFIYLPDSWVRDYETLRSKNDTAQMVDELFMALLIVGMLIVFVQRVREQDVRWRPALIFGGATAVLTFLASLNEFPTVEFDYVTTTSYASFLTQTLVINALEALLQGAAIAFFTAGAESLYREYFPDKLAVQNFFLARTVRTKTFFISVTLGLTLTCFFFAYQTVFYIVANKFGAWAPADVPFDNLLNTKFPWAFVLVGGLFPATSEEFIFRMFAIPFLQRLLKLRWLAIVLAAFIWGFGHAGYPNEPFFIRGLEVGLGGVLLGVVMLRFGILTTLVWHYTVDALYSAILLLRSGNAYYVASGALSAGIMLVPLAVCVVAYLRHKSFAEEDDLTNAQAGGLERDHPALAPPLPEGAVAEWDAPTTSYRPLSPRAVTIGLIAAGVGIALCAVPVVKVGDAVDFAVTRNDAEHAAAQYLRSRGVDPATWRVVTVTQTMVDDHADRYILDHRDVRTLNTVYGKTIPAVVWHTRFYLPLKKEEWQVDVDSRTDSIAGFEHVLADAAPGATLEKDSALAIARAYLEQRGVALGGFTLADATAENRKARRDHVLTWQAIDGSTANIADAKYRVEVQVDGSEVAGFKRLMKLPEDWLREQDQSTAITAVHTTLRILIILAALVLAGWMFVGRVRAGTIAWRPAIAVAAAVLLCAALDAVNRLGEVFAGYQTTMSSSQFVTIALTSLMIGGVFFALLVIAVVGFAGALYPDAFAELRGAARRARARDAVIAAVVFTGVQVGWAHLQAMIGQAFPGSLAGGLISAPDEIASALPAWGILSGAVVSAVMNTAVIAIALYIVLRQLPRRAIVPAAIVVALVLWIPDHGTPVNTAVHVLTRALDVLITLAVIRWILRDNVVAYLAAFFVSACVAGGAAYVGNGAALYRWNGIAMFAVAVAALASLWMLAARRGTRR